MITDSERQEVAKKLREQAENSYFTLMQRWDNLQFTVMGKVYITAPEKVYLAIADLIDVPTCVMTNVGGDFENSFQCSNCMNEFDMPDYDRYPYKRCPECGAVVIGED